MSDRDGSKECISDYGKATRFVVGGRNDPRIAQQKASPPWAVKRALKRLMAAALDPRKPLLPQLRRVFCARGRHLTAAQIIAVKLFTEAMKSPYAMQALIRRYEGAAACRGSLDRDDV